MKVALSSTGKNLNSQIDPRFGRCSFFVIVETDYMKVEAFENESKLLGGGAGIQSATFLYSKGVTAVITGNCGPNAMKTFSEGGISVIIGQSGTVGSAVENYKKGRLQSSTQPTVEEKSGVQGSDFSRRDQNIGSSRCRGGSGRGMGMGDGGRCQGGSGRRMGMGRGGGR